LVISHFLIIPIKLFPLSGIPVKFKYIILCFLFFSCSVFSAERVPGDQWLSYESPSDAGFNPAKLDAARETWEGLPSSAFMIVADGAVVAAWGDVHRRFMCHSVRKSFLSALYGIYWDKGEIELNKTLHDLGIDDIGDGLMETEKNARILDLLKARSGIFHPAAYAGRTDSRPRGSEGPGRYWAYNNWDFNTLVTIFEQETGQKVFEAFDQHFGQPLGMEDWRVSDGYYHYEPEKSEHPAYPFRMSAKDAARFGLLFARDGRWGDEQILSRHWVRRSSAMYSIDNEVFGYGLMWWVARDPQLAANGFFAARGVGNQMIIAMPDSDIVIVNRANTYQREDTPTPELLALIKQVLDARTATPVENPRLEVLSPAETEPFVTQVSSETLDRYTGDFDVPPQSMGVPKGGTFSISVQNGHLLSHSPQQGTFAHYLQEDGTIVEEDSHSRYFTVHSEDGTFSGFADGSMLLNAAMYAFAKDNREQANQYISRIQAYGDASAKIASMILALLDDDEAGEKQARGLLESMSAYDLARATARNAHDLQDAGRPDLAEVLFAFNTRISPQISRVWEDLGDAQRANDKNELALKSYARSLELSPGRERAQERINELRSERR
jgi:CubicO group peptidase (beta-lactamase class C family)